MDFIVRVWKGIICVSLCFALAGCNVIDTTVSAIGTTMDTVESLLEETVEEVPAATLPAEYQETELFYYEQLTEEQQDIYVRLVNACMQYESTVTFPSSVNKSDFIIAYNAFNREYPMYYWTNSYTYTWKGDESKIISISFEVPEDAESVTEQLNQVISEVVANVDNSWSNYQKVKYIYTWIVDHTTYGYNDCDQDIRSVLLQHESVCSGYAMTFKVLCDALSIPCVYVVGQSDGESHAWNLVTIDAEYYWVDTTWGDPVFLEDSQRQDINYYYLCVPDSMLFETHTVSTSVGSGNEQIDNVFSYPACEAMTYEYYVYEGRYFISYSREEIYSFLISIVANGWSTGIDFQYATSEAYNNAVNDLFNSSDPYIKTIMRAIFNNQGSVSYTTNDSYLVITISFSGY